MNTGQTCVFGRIFRQIKLTGLGETWKKHQCGGFYTRFELCSEDPNHGLLSWEPRNGIWSHLVLMWEGVRQKNSNRKRNSQACLLGGRTVSALSSSPFSRVSLFPSVF